MNAHLTDGPTPFLTFDRESWAPLRKDTPLRLNEADLVELRGVNEEVSLAEVAEIYLPLSRLLNLYVGAAQDLFGATSTFLGHKTQKVPYVIGLAGSVAVGKSTIGRILRAILSRWPEHPVVDLVTTDGFLLDNDELEKRNLMHRKGFPETYDQKKLLRFVSDLKSGNAARSPVYSHLHYDIVDNEFITIEDPDIVIIEGLNVLQTGPPGDDPENPRLFVSDFFDFKVFVDAETKNIRQWYVDRFLKLRDTAFRDPESYFHQYADLSDEQSETLAQSIWQNINEINLIENILPTRGRADLILEKSSSHAVERVRLRKI